MCLPFFLWEQCGEWSACMLTKLSKNWVSVRDKRLLDLASFHISTAVSISVSIFHKHSFSSFFFSLYLPSFKTCCLTGINGNSSTDFKTGFRNKRMSPHWSQEPPNFEGCPSFEEDIQIWSRLGFYSLKIVLYFPILLTRSLFLAGRGTMWWCTTEPHSPNRRPTKNRGCLYGWLMSTRNKL